MATQAQYDDIHASMTDAMLITDVLGVIIEVNQAAVDLFTLPRQA